MSGTKEGGFKAASTIRERYGIYFYSKIGKIGGSRGHTGGFYDRELARRAGAIGGLKSKRGKRKPIMVENKKNFWRRIFG